MATAQGLPSVELNQVLVDADAMQILTDLTQVKPEPSCLTIGFFDGVHRGHRYLIGQASASARRQGLKAVLLTFYPHPSAVLRGTEPIHLSTRQEKRALLSTLDLDLIIIQPFTPDVAHTRASQYVEQLTEQIGMVELWVGPDFALGYRREGDIHFLRQMGDERGFAVNVVKRLKLDGAVISSSRIRQALREGDVTLAARCLGRPYSLQGPISGGQWRSTLGFPIANVKVPAEQTVPANGVYAGWVTLCGESTRCLDPEPRERAASAQIEALRDQKQRGVINIASHMNVDDGARTVEAHLLDFGRDISEQQLLLEFVVRLRPEEHVDSAENIATQIEHDVTQARRLLHSA